MSEAWYCVVLCCCALAVLSLGPWYVRHELRTDPARPSAAVLWAAYALVAVVVIAGAARTCWVVLQ